MRERAKHTTESAHPAPGGETHGESVHRQFTATISTARPAGQFAVTAITNAIKADANTIDVSIELHSTTSGLDSPSLTTLTAGRSFTHPDLDATGGRGLQIIAALTARWGVTIDENRRIIVWAHLFCDPLATNGVQCRYR